MSLDVFQVVLVVDDDPGQVAIVTSVLKTAGFRVISATSAPAALGEARGVDDELYLLVTDYSMPEMSGRALAAEVKAVHPGVKILYLTAHADDLFRQASELEAHEAFLEKPVSADGLREAVNLLARGPRAF